MSFRLNRIFGALADDERKTLASAALPPLKAAWLDHEGYWPFQIRALEAWRIAELAGDLEARGASRTRGRSLAA